MDKLVKAQDFTWAMAQVFIWSCCEPFVGIICSCLPTYGPLLRRWWKTASSTDRDQSGQSSFDLNNTVVRNNKARKNWKQLHGEELRTRSEDDLGLATSISGPGVASVRTEHSTDSRERQENGIRVLNVFSVVGGNRAGNA